MQSMTIPTLLCTVKFIFQTSIFLTLPQQVIIKLCKKHSMNYRFYAYKELYLLFFHELNTVRWIPHWNLLKSLSSPEKELI